jgi:hypothetical protein
LNEEKMFPRCGTRSFTSPGVHFVLAFTDLAGTAIVIISFLEPRRWMMRLALDDKS